VFWAVTFPGYEIFPQVLAASLYDAVPQDLINQKPGLSIYFDGVWGLNASVRAVRFEQRDVKDVVYFHRARERQLVGSFPHNFGDLERANPFGQEF